jgi:uncharacterized membrane protein YhdT
MLMVVYIAAALVVAFLGRDRQIGFAGFFLVALLATPVVALIVLMISHHRRPPVVS